jgi:hypothetical protein
LGELYPQLFDDFSAALPIPEYTQRRGFFNLAAHFPSNFEVQPDLGMPPKILTWLISDATTLV